jgi:hypothetical protein
VRLWPTPWPRRANRGSPNRPPATWASSERLFEAQPTPGGVTHDRQQLVPTRVLSGDIEERDRVGETNGLLGRVYKDLWVEASEAGNAAEADGWLRITIATYVAGYEADMRDAYLGINRCSGHILR